MCPVIHLTSLQTMMGMIIIMPICKVIPMSKKKQNEESSETTFEASLKELETIVDALEHGDVPLDETLVKFERGMKLVEFCQAKLNTAEQKLKILIKDKDGNYTLEEEDEEAV